MLFGKNRVLKLAVVNKIVRAQRVQFGNQRPISEPYFSQIAQLTHLSQVNSVPIVRIAMGNSPEHYFKNQSTISKPRRLFQK